MRRCGRSVGQGAVFSAGKMVRGLVLSAGGHTGGGKHASTARRTPTRASCNYGILLKGIKEEQVAGFKNKKGQRMRFNEFLASQVEGLVANFKGTPHEADLQAMLKNARHYPDLTVSTRTQTCDWVSKFVEQHGDVLGLDTNPAEVSGRTPWQASTPRGYGESHAGSSQGTATGPVWLRRGAAGTSSSSRSDTTTSVSGWSDKWRRTQTRDKDSRARNSVPKGPTQFPARPNYATTWRSVEKDKGRTPTAVATVLPPDSSVRHQQEQVASGADPRFETKAEQVKQTSRGMVGSATIGRNSGRKLPAGLPAQGSATTAQVDNMSVRQTSPRGGSGEAAVLENVSVQQLHPLLEKVGPVGPLVVFDLETTGLGINDHGIVEVAAWNLNTGELIQSLINPGDVVWNKHAVRVNGISQGMVSGSGIPTWASFGKWFISWLDKQRWSLDGNPVLVAHNGLKFDYRFLQQKLADVGEKLAPGWRYLDILPWVKSLAALQKELLDNKQETLREHFGIKVAGRAHRAAADVEVLGRVVLKMLDPKICGKPSLEAVVLSQESYAGVLGSFQPQPKSSTRTGDRKGFRTKQRGWEQRAEWQLGTIAEPADADGVPWVSDPLVLVEGAMETGEMPLNAEDKDMEADGATDALCSFLSTPISKATFWTPSQREGLQNAGFESVLQVAMHFPRDFTVFEKNSEIHPGSVLSLMGTVLSISAVYTKNNVCIFNLSIAQEGKEEEIKFSQVFWGMKGKWAGQSLIKSFPSGTKLWLRGHVAGKRGGRYEITDTKYVNADHMEELGTVIDPIYASKGGIKNDVFTGTPKRPGVIARMYKALAEEGLEGADFLPQWLLESQGLKPWMEALKMMHTPAKLEEASAARRRFAAQDMLLLQLALLARRHTLTEPRTDADKEGTCITSLEMMNAGKAALPFELTCDQAQVLEEIVADMAGPRPMLRLLQGDVGTGKTAVTFLAMLLSAGSGWQAALMAPIETLAQQHFKNLCDLISNMPAPLRPKAALLTGSTKTAAKRDLLRRLATGDLQILVGTHALLSEGVDFQKLGLAVIDEQQKFGVRQRERLQRGDISSPHILMTTATPIPRTLALALHGTMVISCIKSMPPGRLPVQTTVVNDEDPQAVAQWQAETNKELDAGGRAFIVYPLIEESTSEGMESVKAAEEEYERMKESRIFGNRQIVLMHGRMSSEEKSERMRAFVDGIAPVMVSTTVIEVGMDVREASIMVVNNADRFGLAQLHQLRGRVGRGSRQSKCFLVSNGGEKALGRLKVLEISNDGHKIAEADLRIRGAGELLGSKQSGFMGMYTLTAADLITEGPLMDEARTAAAQILAASGGQIPQGLQKIMEVQGLLLSEDSELC